MIYMGLWMHRNRYACEGVVFLNLRLRDEDEQLFNTNYVEYVWRDIEEGGTDSWRRIALSFLEGLLQIIGIR